MQLQNDQTALPSATTQLSLAEEISTIETNPGSAAVLPAVFRSIFVDGPKGFLGGIGAFFKRYYLHYRTCLKFFYRPSLKATPFDKGEFRESSQLSFEIVLLLVGALLFLIKQNWIPVNQALQEAYGNDLAQMFMEGVIFLMLASAFFVQLFLAVLAGRLLRLLFSIQISRSESDVLFCFLHNSFFSLSALAGFFLRLGIQYDQIEGTTSETGIYGICFLVSFCLVSWWAVRFLKLHQFPTAKKLFFLLFAIALFTILFGTGMSAICSFMLGT